MNFSPHHNVMTWETDGWRDDVPLAAAFISFVAIYWVLFIMRLLQVYVPVLIHGVIWIVATSLFIAYFARGSAEDRAARGVFSFPGCAGGELQGCNMTERVVIIGTVFFTSTLLWGCVSCAECMDREAKRTAEYHNLNDE